MGGAISQNFQETFVGRTFEEMGGISEQTKGDGFKHQPMWEMCSFYAMFVGYTYTIGYTASDSSVH